MRQTLSDLHEVTVERFECPDSGKPVPNFWKDLPEIGSKSSNPIAHARHDHDPERGPIQADLATELQRSFAEGHAQGIREGRTEEASLQRNRLLEIEAERMAQAASLANEVHEQLKHFLESVEQNVAGLALAIAERVLRREAQLDPLFLVGAVRVALGHLAEGLHVRLRIPSSEAAMWTETISHLPGLRVLPEVVPDSAMQTGDCVLESEMGSADLGLSAQLHTIQHALFDGAQPPRTRLETTPAGALK